MLYEGLNFFFKIHNINVIIFIVISSYFGGR